MTDDPHITPVESLRRTLLRLVVASLIATALLAMATLLAGDFEDTDARIFLTTLAIAFYSLLSLPAGVLLDRRERLELAAAVLWATGAGLLLAFCVVWISGPPHAVVKAWGCVTVGAGALAQLAGVVSRTRDLDAPATRLVAAVSSTTGLLLGALGIIAILGEVEDSYYYRALASLAVANVTLLVLQPLLRRMTGAETGITRVIVELPRDDADDVAHELRARGFRVESR